MKKIIFTLVIIAIGLSAHSTPADSSSRIAFMHETIGHCYCENEQPIFPKDSCIRIYSQKARNGKDVLKFQRAGCFDVEIWVNIWCKYIIINKQTGEKFISQVESEMGPNDLEIVAEWLNDTTFEYGAILDYKVEPRQWDGYFEAYTIGGERLYRYDIEIRKDYNTQEYYVLYWYGFYGPTGYVDVKKSPVVLSNPYQVSFSLEGICERDNSENRSKDITVQARITKDGLRGTVYTDYQLTVYIDNTGKPCGINRCSNCGSQIIFYKKTGAYGVIQSKQ